MTRWTAAEVLVSAANPVGRIGGTDALALPHRRGYGNATDNRLPMRARVLTLIASVMILGALAFPLWTVRLTAPQYPEGLGMQIRVNTVQGATETDLNNINNLNHYIGMKRIESNAIPELRIMPWVVVALALTGLGVVALGRRKLVYFWAVSFVVVAVAGLIDFWSWEYDYGHNLDPRAVLKIPGMTYQPPLIGAKQLLNFRAVSQPGAGGLLVIFALALALAAAVLVWRQRRPRISNR